MERRPMIQEYYALAVNEKGYMPAMRKEESNAGLMAAGIMDLLLNDIIAIEKKKITVIKELPGELDCLASLYAYLKEKTRSTDKVMSDYLASTGSRMKLLMTQVGEALLADQKAEKGEGGLFGNKPVYIPEKSYKQEVISIIKAAAAEDEQLTPHDMTLLCILKETRNLNQYLSEFERKDLKAKLTEMKKNPGSRQLAEMIHYVGDMTAVMVAFVLTA